MNKEAAKRRASVRRSAVGTGTTSLLMIFTVLCFATLAMLSLSTAASHDRIQRRGLEGNQQLATAKGQTAREVAELDALLAGMQPDSDTSVSDLATYYEGALGAAAGRGWEVNRENNTLIWRQPMGDTNLLVTELQLTDPVAGFRYEVVRQVSQIINGWRPEGEGQLWIPE